MTTLAEYEWIGARAHPARSALMHSPGPPKVTYTPDFSQEFDTIAPRECLISSTPHVAVDSRGIHRSGTPARLFTFRYREAMGSVSVTAIPDCRRRRPSSALGPRPLGAAGEIRYREGRSSARPTTVSATSKHRPPTPGSLSTPTARDRRRLAGQRLSWRTPFPGCRRDRPKPVCSQRSLARQLALSRHRIRGGLHTDLPPVTGLLSRRHWPQYPLRCVALTEAKPQPTQI